jgi:hypothetical protein
MAKRVIFVKNFTYLVRISHHRQGVSISDQEKGSEKG